MKALLVAINAKYIHSNLAIYDLKAYASEYKNQIKIEQFTINQQVDDILQSIYTEKPDLIGFSCYIWNISIVEQLCTELRKLLPMVSIWLGGPEVTYNGKDYLDKRKEVDGIILGEGELSFKEVLDYYTGKKSSLSDISGIVYRDETKAITQTGVRMPLEFSTISFPYGDLEDFENKIIYYETSRGCPFTCSYCLSSIEKQVRLRDIELVKKELGFFLSKKVKQVKFVDRTFNCNRAHTLAIWRFIKEHDNGVTNFHFEIAADILDDDEIEVLSSMRKGLVQLEIGVQSTNPDTIQAIHRKTNFEKISDAVRKIYKNRNVHQHLDLIAGLPYEDYKSFRNSFNDVYALRPDQFQLGFLKILKGSRMFYDSREYGIVYKDISPYEVLYTRWLSYDDVLKLKAVEEMVEDYYNSGQFTNSVKFMEQYFNTPFDLYQELGNYYKDHQLFDIKHARIRRYEILIEFMKTKIKDIETFNEILVYDLYLRENLKSRPSFATSQDEYKKAFYQFQTDEDKVAKHLDINTSQTKIGKAKMFFHIEHFNINVLETVKTGKRVNDEQFILFDYMNRNPLNNEARTIQITELIKEVPLN